MMLFAAAVSSLLLNLSFACSPGEYTGGGSSCTKCAPGTFAKTGSEQSCTGCKANEFAAGFGNAACQQCPFGQVGNGLRDACVDCVGAQCYATTDATEAPALRCLRSTGDQEPMLINCPNRERYCFIQIVVDNSTHSGNRRECTNDLNQCKNGLGDVKAIADETFSFVKFSCCASDLCNNVISSRTGGGASTTMTMPGAPQTDANGKTITQHNNNNNNNSNSNTANTSSAFVLATSLVVVALLINLS